MGRNASIVWIGSMLHDESRKLTGTLRGLECDPLQVGGVEDHVHILCGLSRKISLAELIKNLKTSSTRIVKG